MKTHTMSHICKTLLSVLLVLIITGACGADEIRAFSLREADRLLTRGVITNEQLRSLGGITRLAGMVFDRDSKDIILIGKARTDLPAVSLDDLIVALRSRLHTNEYPRVSIDRVKDTELSGMQAVRFTGNIQNSQFGSDFLDSDVALKQYSLNLLENIPGIPSYLSLYENDTAAQLSKQNKAVTDVNWLKEKESNEVMKKYQGKTCSEKGTAQSRFWFYVRDDQSYIVERDDVYVIQGLKLGVRAETLTAGGQQGAAGEAKHDTVGEEFARQFSAGFQDASANMPVLQRLKALFDLVAVSEGIAHLENDRPALTHLLESYAIARKTTPEKYRLVRRVGEFRGSEGINALVELSGGIELESLLLALQDGDVSALKTAVIASRPSAMALCWQVPLDDWAMPNDVPPPTGANATRCKPGTHPNKIGFGLSARYFIIDNTNDMAHKKIGESAGPSAMPDLPSAPVSLKKLTQSWSTAVTTRIEKAVLAEDWTRVAEMIGDPTTDAPAPLRIIMGHACLTLNRNNDSLALFIGAINPLDMLAWQEFAITFKKNHPESQIADYFLGDSLARLGKYDEAIAAFDAGLKTKPNHALLQDAKGVCLAIEGKLSDARTLFTAAFKEGDNTLLDAEVNRGMSWIQASEGAEGAWNDFSDVLDPQYHTTAKSALALHGKALLLLLNKQVTSASCFDNDATEEVPIACDLFAENEMLFARKRDAYLAGKLVANSNIQAPGTTFQTDYQQVKNRISDISSSIQDNTRRGMALNTVKLVDIGRNLANLPQDKYNDVLAQSKNNPKDALIIKYGLDAYSRAMHNHADQLGTDAFKYGVTAGLLGLGALAGTASIVGSSIGAASAVGATVTSVTALGYSKLSDMCKDEASKADRRFESANSNYHTSIMDSKKEFLDQWKLSHPNNNVGNINPTRTSNNFDMQTHIRETQQLIQEHVRDMQDQVKNHTYQAAGIPDPMRSPERWPNQKTNIDINHMDNRIQDQIKNHTYQPASIPSPLSSPDKWSHPGGADSSFEHAIIDEGNWPFHPIYGLTYGLGLLPDNIKKEEISHSKQPVK